DPRVRGLNRGGAAARIAEGADRARGGGHRHRPGAWLGRGERGAVVERDSDQRTDEPCNARTDLARDGGAAFDRRSAAVDATASDRDADVTASDRNAA